MIHKTRKKNEFDFKKIFKAIIPYNFRVFVWFCIHLWNIGRKLFILFICIFIYIFILLYARNIDNHSESFIYQKFCEK